MNEKTTEKITEVKSGAKECWKKHKKKVFDVAIGVCTIGLAYVIGRRDGYLGGVLDVLTLATNTATESESK